jgi:hypothetical protein
MHGHKNVKFTSFVYVQLFRQSQSFIQSQIIATFVNVEIYQSI